MLKDYDAFLESKIVLNTECGFEPHSVNKYLFPFQKHILLRALKVGRFAVFADCGLGKTIIQLEWARLVSEKEKRPVLILAPLAVAGQTIAEGEKFKIPVSRLDGLQNIIISNYEQIDNIDIKKYCGIVLDESSILKNYTGVYQQKLTDYFKDTKYKLCCTATPSPNDPGEIGQHSEFLNILNSTDMRSKWFVRDDGMNNYRLKGHAVESFYQWVSSWAVMISKPSDIGFKDDGFILPKLSIKEIKVPSTGKEGLIFNDAMISATEFQQELRNTMVNRLNKAIKLVNASKSQVIVWIKQNVEADYLKERLSDFAEVRGDESIESKEEKLLGFAKGKYRILITKTKIAQFGLNFQNCPLQIFAAFDFSFESFYQAIRRSWRFGQKSEVNVMMITTDSMNNVLQTVKRKQESFLTMQAKMNKITNEFRYGLKNEYVRREVKTNSSLLINGDCVKEIKIVENDSVDLIIYSPPFSSLFTYSNYIHDMGNNDSHERFFEQYAFLLKELYRVLKPGRLICTHTKDLAVYKNSSGYSGLYNFTGKHHAAMEKAGFKYHSKICIWTDPVLEMQRTKTQRLLYKQVTSDSSYSGIGTPEYVTIFRKWEGNEEDWKPIVNIDKKKFSLDTWQKWASPVWMDIRRTDVLNNSRTGRSANDEKHIAPLQLEVIRRLVHLFSNTGETVLTPFLGIGSEIYIAVKEKRKGIGIELKPEYFDVSVKNVNDAEQTQRQLSFIDDL